MTGRFSYRKSICGKYVENTACSKNT